MNIVLQLGEFLVSLWLNFRIIWMFICNTLPIKRDNVVAWFLVSLVIVPYISWDFFNGCNLFLVYFVFGQHYIYVIN